MSNFVLLVCKIHGRASAYSAVELNKWVVHETYILRDLISRTVIGMGFETKAEYIKHYPGKYLKTNKSSETMTYFKNNFIEAYGINFSNLDQIGDAIANTTLNEGASVIYPDLRTTRAAAKHEEIGGYDEEYNGLNPWWCEDSVGW